MGSDRAARVAVWDQRARSLAEGVVGVDGAVRAWREVPDAKAPVLLPQAETAIAATKADPRVREGLARRGITNLDDLHVETWPYGAVVPAALDDGRRLIWTPIWERTAPDDNAYAHPVAGLHAIVDLDSGEVLDVEDHGAQPVPQQPAHFRAAQLGPPRAVSRAGDHAAGRAGVHGRRLAGAVADVVAAGRVLSPRGAGDPRCPLRRRRHRAADRAPDVDRGAGDPVRRSRARAATGRTRSTPARSGWAYFTNSLELGCDCLGEIRYLDVTVADADGSVRTIQNGICLHEEDDGVLWKHTEPDGHVEVRRSRRFVVSSFVTVDNYEYGYFWYFGQDGAIEFECKMTGIVLTGAGEPGVAPRHGTEVAPGVVAMYHQHIFCARLDLDVDGAANTVVEVDACAPRAAGGQPVRRRVRRGGDTARPRVGGAQRMVAPLRSRYWKVVNASRRNRFGNPVGYKLVPGQPRFRWRSPTRTSAGGRRSCTGTCG